MIFYGCIPFKSDVENATSEPGLFTSTISPNKTMTQTPYKENIFTPTLIPSRTSTITQIPSFTPLPTLSQNIAKQKIYKLVRDNGGCRLPCWWGINPGKTSWNEAHQFLSSIITDTESTKQICYSEDEKSDCFFNFYFKYSYSNDFKGGGNIEVQDQRINKIFIGPGALKQMFQIHQILKEYGKPDEVFIQTDSTTLYERRDFILVLLYSSQYFMAYYTFNAKDSGGIIFGCPREISPQIDIWSSNRFVSMTEIEQWTLGTDPLTTLQPLDKVSNMNIDAFYKAFINPNQIECIQTPISVWEKLEGEK